MRRLILTSPLLPRCNLVNVKYGFLYCFCFCTASAVAAVVLVVVAVITWTALNYSTNHHRHQFHFSLNFNYLGAKKSNKQTNGTFGLPQCITGFVGLILFTIKPGDISYSTIKDAIHTLWAFSIALVILSLVHYFLSVQSNLDHFCIALLVSFR